MRKTNLIITSLILSLLIVTNCFDAIFPYLYFLLFPIFNATELISESISIKFVFLLITIIVYLANYKILSSLNIFRKYNSLNYLSIGLALLSFAYFIIFIAPAYGNFPFKSNEDIDFEIARELDDFFDNKYKYGKANNYSEIEKAIVQFYEGMRLKLSDQSDFHYYFKSYDIENKNKYSALVDTIVFNSSAKYFMAIILIKSGEAYSQTSVIGENKSSNIHVLRNECEGNVSGSNIESMKLSARQFYLLEFNKNKNCRKIFNNFSPSNKEYWEIVEKLVKKQLTIDKK